MRETGISFNGVALAARHHQQSLLQAFGRVVKRGIFLNGPEVALFEQRLKSIFGHGHIVSVASGHDALLLSLQSLHLPKNSEVIFPVNAYPTAFPIPLAGLVPVPADVDTNGQLDPKALRLAITKKTRVVIVVHLYGLIGNLELVLHICKQHHLVLIEDAAQAFGGSYHGKKIGTIGSIGCFSFYPTKNIGSLGDGGAVWTNRASVYQYIKQAKLYGEHTRYDSQFISGHSRLPELQASGLTVYLTAFPDDAKKRQQVASWYSSAWKKTGLTRFGYILRSAPESVPVPHLLVASVRSRPKLMQYLTVHHIPCTVHYPILVHKTRGFRRLISSEKTCPNAERLTRSVISLPFHPFMRKSDVLYVVRTIQQFYETHPTN